MQYMNERDHRLESSDNGDSFLIVQLEMSGLNLFNYWIETVFIIFNDDKISNVKGLTRILYILNNFPPQGTEKLGVTFIFQRKNNIFIKCDHVFTTFWGHSRLYNFLLINSKKCIALIIYNILICIFYIMALRSFPASP